MSRYLVYMGYFGPAFSGIKKDFNAAKSLLKPDITHCLQYALSEFNRGKIQKTKPSSLRIVSRTDIGVHAVRNAFTFDTCEYNSGEQLLRMADFRKGFN